jgi:hypothetical protein
MKNNFALIGIVFGLMLVCSVQSAYAQQPMPETFYGSVSMNGNPVAGTSVVPYNADTDAIADYQNPSDPQNPPPHGNYALDVNVIENISRVYFKINGILANEDIYDFVSGSVTNVDLTATCPSNATEICNGIDDNCNGVIDENFTGNLQKYRGEECEKGVACTESWTCGEWGQCAGGVQTRTCVDANACGTVLQKLSESQTCTGSGSSGTQITNLGEIVCGNGICDDGETCENCPEDCQCANANAQGNQGFNLIGFFTGAPGLSLLGLLALIIIALLLLATRKKKKKK